MKVFAAMALVWLLGGKGGLLTEGVRPKGMAGVGLSELLPTESTWSELAAQRAREEYARVREEGRRLRLRADASGGDEAARSWAWAAYRNIVRQHLLARVIERERMRGGELLAVP